MEGVQEKSGFGCSLSALHWRLWTVDFEELVGFQQSVTALLWLTDSWRVPFWRVGLQFSFSVTVWSQDPWQVVVFEWHQKPFAPILPTPPSTEVQTLAFYSPDPQGCMVAVSVSSLSLVHSAEWLCPSFCSRLAAPWGPGCWPQIGSNGPASAHISSAPRGLLCCPMSMTAAPLPNACSSLPLYPLACLPFLCLLHIAI